LALTVQENSQGNDLGFMKVRVELPQHHYTRTGRYRFKQFVSDCGGVYEASVRLDVPSFFIDQILRDEPVPDDELDVIEQKVGPIRLTERPPTFSDENSAEVPGDTLKTEPESEITLKARQKGVHPSTIRKLQKGFHISETTRHKLGISSEEGTPASAPDHAGANSTAALKNKLREIVKSDLDMFNLASQLGVTPTSLRKIYDGNPISSFLEKKLAAALRAPNLISLWNKPSAQIQRLQAIYNLYKQVGTLEAVGEQFGVTRERIRQLLVQGDGMGLFKYIPYEYPFVSKEKIIEDYMKNLSFSRVARLNNISTNYLRKLLTAYSITEEELADSRVERKRARCIEQYKNLADKAGHHLTTTELQSTSEGHSLHNRINRLWGAIDAFREACNIPKPPQGSSTFRKDTERWRTHQQQIALVSRMQQLDQLREYLGSHGARGTAEIAVDCGLNYQRVLRLLSLLMRAGEVQKNGQGSAIKYILAMK
jgi:hypothetical protein